MLLFLVISRSCTLLHPTLYVRVYFFFFLESAGELRDDILEKRDRYKNKLGALRRPITGIQNQ
jgi:hypothetical protein